MDKYIELIAYYGIDWQQTAIDNTRYSVVLAVFAIFIGGFIVTILKKRKIVKLMHQVMQTKQQLESAEQKYEVLLAEKQNDEQQLATLQQQLEQEKSTLQQEKEQFQSSLASKDELFNKANSERQVEIAAINSTLTDKTTLADQLQSELDEQKAKIAQYTEAQQKIAELESHAEQTAIELNTVKQQLDLELTNKNEQDEQVDKLKQSAQVQINRVLDLESQLEQLKTNRVNEETQQIERLESERKQLEQERQKEVNRAKAIAESEKAVQQQVKQAPVVEEKKEVETKVTEVVNKEVEAAVKPAKVKSKAKLDTPVEIESKPEKKGMLGGVLGWFSSLDDVITAEPVTENIQEIPAKVEDDNKTSAIRDEPQNYSVEEKAAPVAAMEKVTSKPVNTSPIHKELEQEEDDFSGKLAEVADKMDALQGKLKGFFKKK